MQPGGSRRRAAWSRAKAVRLGRGGVEQRVEARGVLAQQPLDALDEILPRARGERPDGLVAEDRLEHLLADRRRAARDDDLRAGEAAGVREDGEHDGQPRPVHPERGDPGRGALRRALLADELEDDALPGANLLLGRRLELRRGAVELRRAVEQRPARNPLAPGARGPLGRALGGGPDDRLDPVLDRDAQLGIGGGRAR